MGGRTVGLFAALFLALAPSFLQRSSLGFYDTEVPGVIGLILFVFFFLRSLDGNRSLRASLCVFAWCRCCFSLLHCRLGSGLLYHWSLCAVRFHHGATAAVQSKNAHKLQHNIRFSPLHRNKNSLHQPELPSFRRGIAGRCRFHSATNSRGLAEQHICQKQTHIDGWNNCRNRGVLCRSGCNWRLRRYSWKVHYGIKPLHQGIVTADRFSRRAENIRLGQPLR